MACNELKQLCPVIQDAGMLPVSALSSCAWQARSVKPCPCQGACHLYVSTNNSFPRLESLRLVRLCPARGRPVPASVAPQASGRDPFSWFLSSHSIDRLVICAQEGGRLLQQTFLVLRYTATAQCTVAAASCACRLALSKGVGAHPVSALKSRLRKSRLCCPASIAGKGPSRLLYRRFRCWMFFIVIHAAGKVPVDTPQQ